jgi:hypothetical protein
MILVNRIQHKLEKLVSREQCLKFTLNAEKQCHRARLTAYDNYSEDQYSNCMKSWIQVLAEKVRNCGNIDIDIYNRCKYLINELKVLHCTIVEDHETAAAFLITTYYKWYGGGLFP